MNLRVLISFFFLPVLVGGCATTPTTTQMQNLATSTSQIPAGYAQGAVESGVCNEISQHRLQGKVGLTLSHDLRMLADEIDNVVTFNGGESYVINSWQWVVVDGMGSTAPVVEITVMDCAGPMEITESEETVET